MKTKIIFSVLCAAFVSFGSLYARGQKNTEETELLWYPTAAAICRLSRIFPKYLVN